MEKHRVLAMTDGVVAIIITIMVLELKVPHGTGAGALRPLLPTFASYVMSFVFLGIYWNNHHHLFQVVRQVNGRILWANLHLLFWLSLVPFVTGWMGENEFAALPVALYGVVMFMAGVAFFILTHVLLQHQGRASTLGHALGGDFKGKISVLLYGAAIPLAFWRAWVACAIYVLVTVMWLIPDPRIERVLSQEKE